MIIRINNKYYESPDVIVSRKSTSACIKSPIGLMRSSQEAKELGVLAIHIQRL